MDFVHFYTFLHLYKFYKIWNILDYLSLTKAECLIISSFKCLILKLKIKKLSFKSSIGKRRGRSIWGKQNLITVISGTTWNLMQSACFKHSGYVPILWVHLS